jgi:restriction system protein
LAEPQCKRYAKHRTVGSRDIQTFNGTARAEHNADAPVFVASCVFTKPARAFAARHQLTLIDIFSDCQRRVRVAR